jgi:hypothetical protein
VISWTFWRVAKSKVLYLLGQDRDGMIKVRTIRPGLQV